MSQQPQPGARPSGPVYPPPPWQLRQPPQVRPPRKARTALVVSLLIGIPTMILLVICGLSFAIRSGDAPAPRDGEPAGPAAVARIDSCAVLGGQFRATVSVTSRATSTRSFRVLVEWKTPDGTRAASDEVLVTVDAGQTVQRQAEDSGDEEQGVEYVCAAEVQ